MANQSHPFYPVIRAEEVTAAQLADELGTQAQKLRVKLRALAAEGKIANNSGS